MGEIEIGDYVRTKDGIIFEVDTEKKNIQINEFMNMRGEKDIVKHSKNIIDLIEVGDYVNGSRVNSIEEGFITTEFCEHLSVTRLDYEIKSIVTKEQFSQMEYRLED